jgi:hypothetical protein
MATAAAMTMNNAVPIHLGTPAAEAAPTGDHLRSAAYGSERHEASGVSEGMIMKLCGWKTRSMFDRYNVIDEGELTTAVALRFNGRVTAKQTPSKRSPAAVSCSPVTLEG